MKDGFLVCKIWFSENNEGIPSIKTGGETKPVRHRKPQLYIRWKPKHRCSLSGTSKEGPRLGVLPGFGGVEGGLGVGCLVFKVD